MILTITIPTYNRPEKVRNTLLRLIPQLNDNVFIRVLDNHSDVDVKSFIYKYNDISPAIADKVEIVRNRTNIGADANFIRCFELCDTPYIWMLGDDDKVEDNAVELILEEIENFKNSDLIGFNFKSNCCWVPRNSTITISSTSELVNKLDTFGNWLFISTSVYKTEVYLKYIRYQSWGAYSMASQIIPPMVAISNNKTFVLSDKYIVTNVPVENKNEKWSDFQLALSLTSILEAPVGFKKDEYKILGKKLDAHFDCIYPREALYIILKSVNYNIDLIDNYHLYIFRQLIKRTYEFRSSRRLRQLFQYHTSVFLMRNRILLKILWGLFPAMKRKSEQMVPFSLFIR